MNDTGWHYEIGDLVEFIHGHLGASVTRTGIVIERSYRMTRDNMYKIQSQDKYYWIARPRMTLLSKVTKASSK